MIAAKQWQKPTLRRRRTRKRTPENAYTGNFRAVQVGSSLYAGYFAMRLSLDPPGLGGFLSNLADWVLDEEDKKSHDGGTPVLNAAIKYVKSFTVVAASVPVAAVACVSSLTGCKKGPDPYGKGFKQKIPKPIRQSTSAYPSPCQILDNNGNEVFKGSVEIGGTGQWVEGKGLERKNRCYVLVFMGCKCEGKRYFRQAYMFGINNETGRFEPEVAGLGKKSSKQLKLYTLFNWAYGSPEACEDLSRKSTGWYTVQFLILLGFGSCFVVG